MADLRENPATPTKGQCTLGNIPITAAWSNLRGTDVPQPIIWLLGNSWHKIIGKKMKIEKNLSNGADREEGELFSLNSRCLMRSKTNNIFLIFSSEKQHKSGMASDSV